MRLHRLALLVCGLLFLAGCQSAAPVNLTKAETALPVTTAANETSTKTATTASTIQTTRTTVTRKQTPAEWDKAQVLANYTEVMNAAKANKPAYCKIQYQSVPKAQRKADGFATTILEPFIDILFVTKAQAEKKPIVREAGSDMVDFPCVNAEKGCYVTDTKLLKSAKAEETASGIRLTLVFKSETNAEPYYASHKANSIGGVFEFARKADFDEALASMPIQDPQYDITYYDCTAVLDYDPAAGRILRLTQTTYGKAEASFAFLGGRNTLSFVVVDTTEITVN
ncbi:MAG: hypothetical protein LBR73_02855 [Oscillospiraceae bacterium]|jgi:hypothetical protein|nr:hypothetical protein [Oscillospiraceae bacterium]